MTSEDQRRAAYHAITPAMINVVDGEMWLRIEKLQHIETIRAALQPPVSVAGDGPVDVAFKAIEKYNAVPFKETICEKIIEALRASGHVREGRE